MFLIGTQLQYYGYGTELLQTLYDDVCGMYNRRYYYTMDGTIGHTTKQKSNLGYHKTDDHVMMDIDDDYKIVLNVKTNVVEYHTKTRDNVVVYNIGCSYYHVESFGQYNNSSYDVIWSPNNHHLFDNYTDGYVKNILTCHKYGKLKQWIPKGVLYLILQFVL